MKHRFFLPHLLLATILFLPFPSMAWENPCYTGSLSPKPFPRENRSMLNLEARRVVSVEGSLMTYDLGGDRVSIRLEGMAGRDFLKDLQKGKCGAKGFVTIETEKKSFSDTGTYKAVVPSPR